MHKLAIGFLALLLPATTAAQHPVRGLVYDSLLHAPLAGAEVWVRGSGQRAETDSTGRFRLDSVAAGPHMLLVSHSGLDSAGVYTLAFPFVASAAESTLVSVATPSLGSLWRRRCGQELQERPDSGLVYGVIQDAATQDHLAGAGVMLQWLHIVQTDPTTVVTDPRSLITRTDSTGTYYGCGVARDTKVSVRAYARADSSGLVDVQLGPRGVGRQDLLVALAPPPPAVRTQAVLRGTVTTSEQLPVYGGRVTVREGGSTVVNGDGGFVLRDVPPGTQWVTVQAIGRAPFGEAVDLRGGDTAWLPVTLAPLPVTLAPVRVTTQPAPLLAEFEERRRSGLGYYRNEAELATMSSVRAALTTLPTVRFARGAGLTDFIVLLPNPGIGARGYCVAGLYIDGAVSNYEQLHSYRPSDLVGIEVYPRAASAPLQYQSVATGCGVVLVWTKYLK
jgi:hypothetical protein